MSEAERKIAQLRLNPDNAQHFDATSGEYIAPWMNGVEKIAKTYQAIPDTGPRLPDVHVWPGKDMTTDRPPWLYHRGSMPDLPRIR